MRLLSWLLAGVLSVGAAFGQGTPIAPPASPFIATGGTTSRTLADRAADVINAADYGMVCNGATDDSAALSSAVGAATAGKTVFIPFASTCILGSRVTVSQPNIAIQGVGFATVLQRKAGFTTPQILLINGANVTVRDLTLSSGAVLDTSSALQLNAAGGIASHIQTTAIHDIGVAVTGANCRVTGSTLTGDGSATGIGMGIWSVPAVGVNGTLIDNNVITGWALNGIFISGTNFRIIGNYLSNNAIITATGGGQMAFPSNSTTIGPGTISGNTISTRGGIKSYGMEFNGNGAGSPVNLTVTGNTIDGQGLTGVTVNANTGNVGLIFAGNTIRNTLNGPGFDIGANDNNVQVTNNRIFDDQGVPTQTYGFHSFAGTGDGYTVSGNFFSGNTTAAISDNGTGLNKTIGGNIGLDNIIPSVASAAALALPYNPTISMTGTTGVTSFTGPAWTGRVITIIPSGVVTFTAGGNIANTLTTTAGAPVVASYDGSLWHLK